MSGLIEQSSRHHVTAAGDTPDPIALVQRRAHRADQLDDVRLVDTDIHADHGVPEDDIPSGTVASSRIDDRLSFQTAIAPPREQLRGINADASRHRRNARPSSYRLSLELI